MALCVYVFFVTRRAGPTRGGGKGKAVVGLNEPALVLDAQLEARLAEHNKGVARGKHTYEPKRNLRDTRMVRGLFDAMLRGLWCRFKVIAREIGRRL